MQRLTLLSLASIAALAVAAPVMTATRTVTITSSGFSPKDVTIAAGDSVTWQNADTVAHQVVFDKAPCTLTIQAGSSGTCTFRTVGKLTYREPSRRGGSWRGSVTVKAAPTGVTIAASRSRVIYGGSVGLSGAVSNQKAGERVTVQASPCGAATATTVGTATTTTGGAWTLVVKPTKNTTYRARWKSTGSASIFVRVAPRIQLRKLATRRFAVRVLAAQSFATKLGVFQRYSTATRRWVRVRFVVLRAGGAVSLPLPGTMVSKATFRAKVKSRLRVRVVMTQTQVGACYSAGRSNVIRS
jgi:plastocyanin